MEPPQTQPTTVVHDDSAAHEDAEALATLLEDPRVEAFQRELEAQQVPQPDLGNRVMEFAASLAPEQPAQG